MAATAVNVRIRSLVFSPILFSEDHDLWDGIEVGHFVPCFLGTVPRKQVPWDLIRGRVAGFGVGSRRCFVLSGSKCENGEGALASFVVCDDVKLFPGEQGNPAKTRTAEGCDETVASIIACQELGFPQDISSRPGFGKDQRRMPRFLSRIVERVIGSRPQHNMMSVLESATSR